MNLDEKSIEELIELKNEIEKLIKTKKKEKKKKLLTEFKELAKKEGLSIDEVLGVTTKTKPKVQPKYKNETGDTWTGKGRKPAWVKKIIDEGGNLDNWLIL